MPPIRVDADLWRKLAGLHQSVELCDPNGKVFGRFIPVFDPNEWESIPPEISDEERERRKKSTEPRYSSEEFIRRLESM